MYRGASSSHAPKRHSVLVSVLFLWAVSACGGESNSDSPIGSSTERPISHLSFRPCGALECAEVLVPLSYEEPQGEQISIAINRMGASLERPYRGVILFNPGGPGVEGKGLLNTLGLYLRQLLPGFDLVSFDPRGVGESSPLPCQSNLTLLQTYNTEGIPGVLAEVQGAGDACRELSGPLFDRLGSNQIVEDVEQIRQALGHEQIHFWGISYGTRLATLYAMRYPAHVRALILDAAVPRQADLTTFVDGQFDALLLAHEQFFEDCEAGILRCPADARATFAQLIDTAEGMGLLEQVVAGWALALSNPVLREDFAATLVTVANNPRIMLVEQAGTGLQLEANITVLCADQSQPGPTEQQLIDTIQGYQEAQPLLFQQTLPMAQCAAWPVSPDPVLDLSLNEDVGSRTLIIGGLNDSLTPIRWARELGQALAGSFLLESDHYGHGALVAGGSCVFDAVRSFLLRQPNPPPTTCPAP